MGIAAALLIGYLIFGGGDTNINITDSTEVTVEVGSKVPEINSSAVKKGEIRGNRR